MKNKEITWSGHLKDIQGIEDFVKGTNYRAMIELVKYKGFYWLFLEKVGDHFSRYPVFPLTAIIKKSNGEIFAKYH